MKVKELKEAIEYMPNDAVVYVDESSILQKATSVKYSKCDNIVIIE
jgi:hypothetical protein